MAKAKKKTRKKVKEQQMFSPLAIAAAAVVVVTVAFALLSNRPTPEPGVASSAPTPTQKPTSVPQATAVPQQTSLFKMNSIATWNTARPTLYPFGIYAYQPLSEVTFTYEGETSIISSSNGGQTYAKAYKLKPGTNTITVKATSATGQSQSGTFTVSNSDSLSDVDPSVAGTSCSESDTQHCKAVSGYSYPGQCTAYRTYILCLQSKCNINTIAQDPSC
jgi:hypothetical protein